MDLSLALKFCMHNIRVSVVYVDAAGGVFDQSLSLPPNSTVADAVTQSVFLQHYPHLQLAHLNLGVYSVRKILTDPLQDHDRIEIYRPLLIDPKDRRRQMVDKKRSPKKWRQDIKQQRKL